MVPHQLSLQNFLSYRDVKLDFTGLHTACIWGANGAGKSSLLEAITWAIWGKSRVNSEDDAISFGAANVRVDFIFELRGLRYRVLRARQRQGTPTLEFQVEDGSSFRSLTQKGVKATQAVIDDSLRIDYDTFINSAYLRQGNADEFMSKSPKDRKQILADLLKLDRYDVLADKAKDKARDLKNEIENKEASVAAAMDSLLRVDVLLQEREKVEVCLEELQVAQVANEEQLAAWQSTADRRETHRLQLEREIEFHSRLTNDRLGWMQESAQFQQDLRTQQEILAAASQIEEDYRLYRELQVKVDLWQLRGKEYDLSMQEKQRMQQEFDRELSRLQMCLGKAEAELELLANRRGDLEGVVNNRDKLAGEIANLQAAKERLSKLEDLQKVAMPYQQQKLDCERSIERSAAMVKAKLAEIERRRGNLQSELAKREDLEKKLAEAEAQIKVGEDRRTYLKRVEDKGLVARDRVAELAASRETQKRLLDEALQKVTAVDLSEDANCPLCDSLLAAGDWHSVKERINGEIAARESTIVAIAEEIAVAEKERDRLRQEYRELQETLKSFDVYRETKGQILAALETIASREGELARSNEESAELAASLADGSHAAAEFHRIREIDGYLAELNYDEKTHSLARSEVERLRWVDIQASKLEEATRQLTAVNQQIATLQAQIEGMREELTTLPESSAYAVNLQTIVAKIASLNYDRDTHQQLLSQLNATQTVELKILTLNEAKQKAPQLTDRIAERQQRLDRATGELERSQQQITTLTAELTTIPDLRDRIAEITATIQKQKIQRDTYHSQIGGIDRELNSLEEIRARLVTTQSQIEGDRHQLQIYSELQKAFGKNGIQTLIIENVLPQLETESNRILKRLSGNQLHVQFITQKLNKAVAKSRKKSLANVKSIETLDILIGDASGTRPYETYSGGEAFRIDFSIRLALAKLLAQRAGTPLQMLIVDEGFGTQDREGCERLVAAINAISSDFACILAVTHIPQLREAFQTRIEVRKTDRGSELEVII
jgi:exonuclease SbcC